MEPVSLLTDPAEAVRASEAALAAANAPAIPEPERGTPPAPPEPADTTVTLPGGYVVLKDGEVYTTAEIRELDGEDEEAIARVSNNFAKLIEVTLQRGVVSVGPYDADKKLLDALLMGDRDHLLVHIYRITFGDEVEYLPLRCPACGTEQSPSILLSKDVPTRTLANPMEEITFDLSLKSGKNVKVTLPNGAVQYALASLAERTEAAMSTEMLLKCVKAIDGVPVLSRDDVRKKLKIRDRQEIRVALEERNPGPRLGEVSQPCVECGETIPLSLTLADMFRA